MSVNRPCGVHNESYAQELIIVRTPTQWIFLVLGLAFLITLPLYSSGSILNIINYIGITIIALLGLHILMGYCGQISIGQSAFMAVGAYWGGMSIVDTKALTMPLPALHSIFEHRLPVIRIPV